MGERTVGVEEEFLLFDTERARLVDVGPNVVAAAERADADAQFAKELKRAQAEHASPARAELSALANDLSDQRNSLVHEAGRQGARVVASGTCPVPGSTRTTDDERYRALADRFAALERRQLTCAMHVHVSIESDEKGVLVLDRIAPWLSVLAALTANSPFHDGRNTGYASYRWLIWDEWPTAGPTGPFTDAADYRATARELVATGAARDHGMIYFDARLSTKYPTVEIRVCDVCPDVADAVTIAGLCKALVATGAHDEDPHGIRIELLRAAAWRAARWGMTGELVDLTRAAGTTTLADAWDLADALVRQVSAALDAAGDLELVRCGLERIRRRGTGAARQRAAVEAAGGNAAAALAAVTLR